VPNALGEFRTVLSDFRSLSSLALKGAVVAPLAAMWLKTGLPQSGLMAGLTSLAEFVTIASVFQVCRDWSAAKLKMRMRIFGCWFALGLVGFLIGFGVLTTVPGMKQDRVVKGFIVRDDVSKLLSPAYSADDALRDSEYDPNKVWTTFSVLVSGLLLQLSWLSMFTGFAAGLTVVSLLERRRGTDPVRIKGSSGVRKDADPMNPTRVNVLEPKKGKRGKA
jgi:hypothetical protein